MGLPIVLPTVFGGLAPSYRSFAPQSIRIVQGQDSTLPYQFFDADGVSALNLTNWTIKSQARIPQLGSPVESGAVVVAWTPIVTPPATNGLAAAAFPAALANLIPPGWYVFDVWGTDGGGNQTRLVAPSPLYVAAPVTAITAPAPTPPSQANRIVVVTFANQQQATAAFTPFVPAGTQSVLDAGAIVITSGPIPAGWAVTALSNGSVTVTATAAITGSVILTIQNQ